METFWMNMNIKWMLNQLNDLAKKDKTFGVALCNSGF